MLCRLLIATVLLLGSLCGRAHCQRLMDVDMQALTETLGQRFQEIRRDALGVEALEAEYNRVGFTQSALEQSRINELLSNPIAPTTITNVLALFDELNSNISAPANPFSIAPTTECCGIDLTGVSTPQACCHSCNTTTVDANLLMSVAEAYRDANIPGIELELGLVNGSLLRFPASQPSTTCNQLDARLRPWFIDVTRARPREVVLLVDLNENFAITARANFGTLRTAARAVVNSLTPQDKVGVVAFGSRVVLSPVNPNSQVVPACSNSRAELDSFIATIDNLGTPGVIVEAFQVGFSLFTNDAGSDKLLLLFSDGTLQYSNPDQLLLNITGQNRQAGNNAIISVYRAREPTAERFLQPLTNQTIPGILITESEGESVASYYLPLLNGALLSTSVRLGRTTVSSGAPALSISTPYFQDSTLVGVLHAALPWRVLFGHIDAELSNRDSSYFFVATRSGQALYHPLFPGDSQSDVPLAAVETESEIATVLNTLEDISSVNTPVEKSLLVHTGGTDSSSFILKQVPSTYHCRNLEIASEEILIACLVLAASEVNSTALRSVDVTATYASSSPTRQPIYHDTSQSIPATADRCNYFCKISRTDRISYQLTSPSVPPDGTTLDTITSFVTEEAGPPPPWAVEGVPSDVAINSIVSSYWLNRSVDLDVYITRRHLATPLGTYLSYPPAHLNTGFLPRETVWYQASSAHPSTLTLTPPREDPLLEGGLVCSIGYALRVPESGSDQNRDQVLSVVAADITFASLRVIVEETLSLCTQSQYSCFIVDSIGNLVYHRSLFEEGYTGNPPTFFARDLGENRMILSDLLSRGVALKQQCGDYFDIRTRQRLFYNLVLSSTTYSNFDPSRCIHYMLRRIPGTNAFFAVLERRATCNVFCLCNEGFSRRQCFDCNNFQPNSCECPCVCDDEDCTPAQDLIPCPRISAGSNLQAVEISATTVSNPNSDLPPYCFNQACGCRRTLDSCLGVHECHWCEQEQSCVHITECCDGDRTCCVPGSSQGRFTMLPLCIEAACFVEFVTPPEFTCPSESDNTAVIAGVIGGVVGFLLLLLLLVFVLWYQICRDPDYEDNEGKENAFDFSKRRVETVNIAALEEDKQQDVDSKTDLSGSKNDGASSGAASKPSETIL